MFFRSSTGYSLYAAAMTKTILCSKSVGQQRLLFETQHGLKHKNLHPLLSMLSFEL